MSKRYGIQFYNYEILNLKLSGRIHRIQLSHISVSRRNEATLETAIFSCWCLTIDNSGNFQYFSLTVSFVTGKIFRIVLSKLCTIW